MTKFTDHPYDDDCVNGRPDLCSSARMKFTNHPYDDDCVNGRPDLCSYSIDSRISDLSVQIVAIEKKVNEIHEMFSAIVSAMAEMQKHPMLKMLMPKGLDLDANIPNREAR